MTVKHALFPGSFAPPTLGHLDIIRRSAPLCEALTIGIAHNPKKGNSIFSVEDRIEMLTAITKDLNNVTVSAFDGLVVDYAKKMSIDCIIRGLRAFSDFEFEFQMALANRKMTGIETLFLMADERYCYTSSSLIREIASNGRHLEGFVPKEIEPIAYQKLSQQTK